MLLPICGLCQRTGGDCTFPKKRKAPEHRNPINKESQKAQKDRLDRLVSLLEARLDGGRSVGDLLSPTDRPTWMASASLDVNSTPPAEHLRAGHSDDLISAASYNDLNESVAVDSRQAECQRQFSEDALDIPGEVAGELVGLFFDKIQPWLPIFHRPRFWARYMDDTLDGHTSCRQVLPEEAFMLNGIFALSARYSSSPYFGTISQRNRGNRFAERAMALYRSSLGAESSNLVYLQGCILLAFYCYTSGPCRFGWMLTGLCVRLAYDLGLDNMDECDDSLVDTSRWVRKEELRRAWWLVWELDAFGSTMLRRPYAIDRHRMTVRLPVSDEAWFAGTPLQSAPLRTKPVDSWKSLHHCENQDARALFLVANYMMTLAHDMTQAQGGSKEEAQELADSISCFALSLPQDCRLGICSLTASALDVENVSTSNWIICLHLMLETARSTVDALDAIAEGKVQPRCWGYAVRGREMSRIVARWSAEHISVSHPFIACIMLLPSSPSFAISLVDLGRRGNPDLFKLVLDQYAAVWNLGSILLRIRNLVESGGDPSPEEESLAKLFAMFSPYSINRIKALGVDSGPVTRSVSSVLPQCQPAAVQACHNPSFFSRRQPSPNLLPPPYSMVQHNAGAEYDLAMESPDFWSSLEGNITVLEGQANLEAFDL
ncbi:hypothetical protein GQ53DRAFT_94587 [Thozetella sp. PMI_491]|nr:hypothetical protein GQ53DRAFT_94587 [Thozetella sp. PMI_491]